MEVLFNIATKPLTYVWVCAILASTIYIRNIWKGTEVSSAMWFVYWIMGATLFLFHWTLTCKASAWVDIHPLVCSNGKGWSDEMWLLAFYAVVPGVYLLITLIKKGTWSFDPVEKLMLKLAGVVWLVWVSITCLVETNSPVLGFLPSSIATLPLLLAIPIDAIGTLTGMRHAHYHGGEYINRHSWFMTSIAVLINLAVTPGGWMTSQTAYPLYLAVAMPLFCVVVCINTPTVAAARAKGDTILKSIIEYKAASKRPHKPAKFASRYSVPAQ